MTITTLRQRLQGLPTERLQRLADRLGSEPDRKVTVAAWRLQCPMVLAGYDPELHSGETLEYRFTTRRPALVASDPTRCSRLGRQK